MVSTAHSSEYDAGDSDFIRCKWCGIPLSIKWAGEMYGRRYWTVPNFCSQDCQIANAGYENIRVVPAIMGSIGLGSFFLMFQTSPLVGLFLASIMSLGGYVLYHEERMSADSIRTRIPKDSRRYDPIFVKEMSSVAKCPYCDGNLDIDTRTTGNVIKCEYCGAMGVLKIES
ncbi:MAG: hypothetical protein ACFFCP_07710 [Promethearchaeota archaeon]